MELTEEQIERYSRQIILKEVGGQGQIKLLRSRVLVVGAGGLGAPIVLYLAAAGIGTIGIMDDDQVELSNLQRQIIHSVKDIKKDKVGSAKEKIHAINEDLEVHVYKKRLEYNNAEDIIRKYDFIIDATDNFSSKFLINDACVITGKPFSHGGVLRFQGQTMTVIPGESACYRCVFHAPPKDHKEQTCQDAGVLGTVPGVIGCVQATEAIKFLLGKGTLLTNVILTYDALSMDIRKVEVKKNTLCPVCGRNPTIKKLEDTVTHMCDLTSKD